MRIRYAFIGVIAAVGVFAATATSVGAATATPAGQVEVGASSSALGKVTGVDVAVATKNGFTPVSMSGGRTAIYSTAALDQGRGRLGLASDAMTPALTNAVQPVTTVAINAESNSCGHGFEKLNWFVGSNGKYQEESGFEDSSSAVSYSWVEHIGVQPIPGPLTQSYTVTQGGGLLFRTEWTGQHTATNSNSPLFVYVYSAGAWVLYDGVDCAVGLATIEEYVPHQ